MIRPMTPWGIADDAGRDFGGGLTFYTTASHGGFFVPPDMRAQMPDALRAIPTFAGGAWYEEDCDAALIPLAFPHLFTPKQVNDAATTARAMRGMWSMADAVVAFLDSNTPGALAVIARSYADQQVPA